MTSLIPRNIARSTFLGFEDLFDRLDRSIPTLKFPHYNVSRDDQYIHIEVALAGYKKENISVELDTNRNTLRISGKAESKSQSSRLLAQGISQREFSKEFTIADGVTVASAKLEDGILTVTLEQPLAKAEVKPQLIPIQ